MKDRTRTDIRCHNSSWRRSCTGGELALCVCCLCVPALPHCVVGRLLASPLQPTKGKRGKQKRENTEGNTQRKGKQHRKRKGILFIIVCFHLFQCNIHIGFPINVSILAWSDKWLNADPTTSYHQQLFHPTTRIFVLHPLPLPFASFLLVFVCLCPCQCPVSRSTISGTTVTIGPSHSHTHTHQPPNPSPLRHVRAPSGTPHSGW